MRRRVGEALRAGALGFATGRTTMHRTPAGTRCRERSPTAASSTRSPARWPKTAAGVFELVPYGAAGEDAGGLRQGVRVDDAAGARHQPPVQHRRWSRTSATPTPGARRCAGRGGRGGAARASRRRWRCAASAILMGFGIVDLSAGALPRRRSTCSACRATRRSPAARSRRPRPLVESARTPAASILGGMATLDHVFPLDGRRRARVRDHARAQRRRAGARSAACSPRRADARRHRRTRGAQLLPGAALQPRPRRGRRRCCSIRCRPSVSATRARTRARPRDAGYATFVLAYWVRERRLLSLERMVHKLDRRARRRCGASPDRGVLRRGAFADLNVIDLDRLDLRLPEVRHDLPDRRRRICTNGRPATPPRW